MMSKPPWTIETTYDRVAAQYAATLFDELSKKPFDRQLLEDFATRVRHQGLVCDLGCGPGHVARYLKDQKVDVCGVDLSQAMIACASERSPDISFRKGDMRALDFPPAALAGITAFYSIIHLRRHEAPQALQEFHRVLQPEAWLLLAFHGGESEVHTENWFDQGVSIDATQFSLAEMTGYLQAAGFRVEQAVEREPYDFEYASRRVYILAMKDANAVAFGQPQEPL